MEKIKEQQVGFQKSQIFGTGAFWWGGGGGGGGRGGISYSWT